MTESDQARIPPVRLDRLAPAQQEVADRIAGTRGRIAGPFTVLLHVPVLTDRVQHLGAYLRYEATLDRAVAETAVLVTARVCDSPFEWEAHEPHARAAGVPDDVIAAVRTDGPSDGLPPPFSAIVDYARELAASRRVSDEAYRAVVEILDVEGTVELTVLVGYYALLAMTLAAHHVEPPDVGARFFARSAERSS